MAIILAVTFVAAQDTIVQKQYETHTYSIVTDVSNTVVWNVYSNVGGTIPADSNDYTFVTGNTGSQTQITWNKGGDYWLWASVTDASSCKNVSVSKIIVAPMDYKVRAATASGWQCYSDPVDNFTVDVVFVDGNGQQLDQTYFPIEINYQVDGIAQPSQTIIYSAQTISVFGNLFTANPGQDTDVTITVTGATGPNNLAILPDTTSGQNIYHQTLLGLPQVQFDDPANETLFKGTAKSYSVTGETGHVYSWSLTYPDNTSISLISTSSQSDEITFDQLGVYTLEVQATDTSGCLSEVIQKEITIEDISIAAATASGWQCYSDPVEDFDVPVLIVDGDNQPLGEEHFPMQVAFEVDGVPQDIQFISYDNQSITVSGNMFTPNPDQDVIVEITITHAADQNHLIIYPDSESGNSIYTKTLFHLPQIEFVQAGNENVYEGDRKIFAVVEENGYTYSWTITDPGNVVTALLSDSAQSDEISFDQFGNYTLAVHAVDTAGCMSDVIQKIITTEQVFPFQAVDDENFTFVGVPVSGDVSTNDYDPNGLSREVVYSIASLPSTDEGTVVLNTDGTYTFTPADGFSGITNWTYQVCDTDRNLECTMASVTINVLNLKSSTNIPVATNDEARTIIGQAVSGMLLSNDFDIDNDEITVNTTPVSGPLNGSVVINPDGTFTYTPNPGFSGIDQFTYEISDKDGTSSATVTINVDSPSEEGNNPPFAGDDAVYSTGEAVTISLNNNDWDPDGDEFTYSMVRAPSNGSVTLSSGGTLVYAPNDGFEGTEDAIYEICDNGTPVMCARATIHFIVDLNEAPVAVDDVYETLGEDVEGDLSENDSDPDQDSLIYNPEPISGPGKGSLIIHPDGTFVYTPDPDAFGQDEFVYEVCDDRSPALCDQATVTIAIGLVPIAVDDDVQTIETDVVSENVLTNDNSPGGEVLTVSSMSGETSSSNNITGVYGILDWSPDGLFTYTPNADMDSLDASESVIDAFLYVVINESGNKDSATLYVTIVGRDNVISVSLNSYCQNDAAYVHYSITSNFTISEANPVSMRWIDGTNQVLQFRPDLPLEGDLLWPGVVLDGLGNAIDWPGWIQVDGRWVTGNDGFQNTRPYSTLEFSVNPVSAVVVAYPPATPDCVTGPAMELVDDTSSTTPVTPVNIDILSNDSGIPKGATLDVPDLSEGGGTLTTNVDGTVVYTPAEGFLGVDKFTYEVCDDTNPPRCDQADVFITVGIVEKFRTATNDINTIFMNQIAVGNVMLNDEGYYGHNSSVSLYLEPINGHVVLNTNGEYSYTPELNFLGTDNFYYTVCTEEFPADCDTVNVTIIVMPDSIGIAAPVANDDETKTTINKPVTSNLLYNDFSPSGDKLILNRVPVEGPDHGSVVIDEDGNYTYTPDQGFVGTDYFIYEVCGYVYGLCARARVTITVNNDMQETLLFAADDAFFTYGDPVEGNLLTNDIYPDSLTLQVNQIPVQYPAYGSVQINSDGTFVYTPDSGFIGSDIFVYEICDEVTEDCDNASVIINVLERPIEYVDLSIHKQAPFEARVGQSIEFSLIITNHGNIDAHGVQVSDFLPEYVLNPTYLINDNVLAEDWTGLIQLKDTLHVNESVLIHIFGTIAENAPDTLTNFAAVGSPAWDPDLNNNISIVETVIRRGPLVIIEGSPLIAIACCDLQPVTLNAGETIGLGVSYSWSPSIYLDDPESATPVFTPGETTQYVLTVTDKNGLIDTDTLLVKIFDCPDAVTDANVFVETPTESILLLGGESTGAGITYNWWSYEGIIIEGETTSTAMVSGLGKYYLQVTDSLGCTNIDSVTVGLYVQAFNDTVETIVNVPVNINVTRNDSPQGNLDPTSITIVTPPQHGTTMIQADSLITYSPEQYYVGTDEFVYAICDFFENCDEATVLVLINDIPFFIPEAFSPNGDEINDEFEIKGLSKYNKVSIQIFNRWGNILYSSENYGEGEGKDGFWDGTANRGIRVGTNQVPTGTYFYIINLDGREKINGSVYLDR